MFHDEAVPQDEQTVQDKVHTGSVLGGFIRTNILRTD